MARTATNPAATGHARSGRKSRSNVQEVPGTVAAASVSSVQDKLFQAIESRIVSLLRDNAEGVMSAYKEAIDLHNENDSDKKFKYKLPISVSITGVDPDTYEVEAKIAYAVKRTDTRTALVKTGEDLVDMMDASGAGSDEDDEN